MIKVYDNIFFMKQALEEAKIAFDKGEVPVGAIITSQNKIIARSHNNTEQLCDVTAHAEIMAITSASNFLGSKYLNDCTLYVTLEPCIMCAGALFWSQIGKIVFGAADEKRGFMTVDRNILHPKTKLEYGVLHEECSSLLKAFFEKKRTLLS